VFFHETNVLLLSGTKINKTTKENNAGISRIRNLQGWDGGLRDDRKELRLQRRSGKAANKRIPETAHREQLQRKSSPHKKQFGIF
jgi:hypothetical protein